MSTLIVNIRVIEERIEDFKAATFENVEHSRKEPGISRFELYQDEADRSRFVLLESYSDQAAQAAHRETVHYLKWKELVEPMMAEPRTRALYAEL